MTRRALPLATSLLLAALPVTGQAPPPAAGGAQPLTIETIFAADSSGHVPTQLAWSPDGKRLVYLYKEGRGADESESLRLLDATTGATETVLTLAKVRDETAGTSQKSPHETVPAEVGETANETAGTSKSTSQDRPSAIDSFHWSPRGDSLLLVTGGDLQLLSLADRSLRRLTTTASAEEDPKFSPDGGSIAFVRGYDLHLLDLATGKERELTRGGKKNRTLNGTTDWVYWEEIWDRDATGYWWSPDGRRIAYYQFDESPVHSHPLVDYAPAAFAADPTVEWQKYPRAGEPNPKVRVGVLDLASGRTTWMATSQKDEDVYLARVDWSPDSQTVAIQRLNREQTRLDLLACRPADGACAPRHTEEQATWVNLGRDLEMLADGRFVWASEKGGWRRLWLYGPDGAAIRPLTPESWGVTSLDGVTADGRAIATGYQAGGMGAARRQVIAVRLADGAVETLAGEPGWNLALVAPATGNWVHTWSDQDHPQRYEVRRGDGAAPIALPVGLPAFDPSSLPRWELLTIRGPGGQPLPARMLKPAGLDPKDRTKRYPAVIYHYGGPASQVVNDIWDPRGRDLWQKMMAQRGFAVFMVDNLSSLFFGKAGEDRDYRRFGEGDLAAQLAAVDYLKSLGWVDTSRLGLWGWSGGGANTLYCLLNRPGVWRAGMAGAPVTDWSLYDSIWTERYLDRPQDDPEGYRLSSPATYAGNLEDHLLIVHGTADDNVHPQNTIALTARWIDAGIPFEEAIYPRQKHGFQRDANRHFYARMTEFFERTLEPAGSETNLSAPRP